MRGRKCDCCGVAITTMAQLMDFVAVYEGVKE